MENLINLNVIAERDIVRNDEVSELDVVIELVTGEEKERQKLKQTVNLCIVIDRSGSMNGEKLEMAKKSCIQIFNRMKKEDLFTVVVYDDEAQVIINPQTEKKEVVNKIQGIASGGQTNLSLGWYLGLLELQTYMRDGQVNKLIILSDGQANAGETKKSVLGSLSSKAREEFGITTSTVGIGDDFNEELLDMIASESGGRFWFIKQANIESIIESEFEGALDILIESPKVEIIFPKGVTISKELNELRKISDRYSIRPITTNYDNSFAMRLEVDPKMIEEGLFEIKAILYNRTSIVAEYTKRLTLDTFSKVVLSPRNSNVSAIVMKYEKSKTEERMIEKLDVGDFSFMKDMIVKEVAGMRILIDGMEDERRKKSMQQEMGDVDNMKIISEILDKLDSLHSDKYKGDVNNFVAHCRKTFLHQSHRGRNMHMWAAHDTDIQTDLVNRALLLVETLLEDYPGDIELENIKKDLNDKLASY